MAILVFFLFIFFIIFTIIEFNILIRYKNNVLKSKSIIDVYLQQRFDLIPNLVDITKNYAQYEKQLLDNISNLRAQFNKTKNIEISNKLNSQYLSIIANVENYPALKANEQFLNLQKNLSKIESQLQASRRLYNNDVTKYNSKIGTFPTNIFAKIFGFKSIPLFVLEGENKVNVEI